jgi:hypothetical protein
MKHIEPRVMRGFFCASEVGGQCTSFRYAWVTLRRIESAAKKCGA